MGADDIVKRLQKQHGKELVGTGGSHDTGFAGGVVRTGSLGLDLALGIGGLPRGRVVEVYGPASAGKTTLTLHIIAEAQKSGDVVAFVDAEHALDPRYAQALGVDMDLLLLSQPDSGEQALNVVESMVDEGVRVVVVDSVAALVPQAEIDGEIGDKHIGLQARMMGQALRKLCRKVSRTGALVIFINQIRMKIGVQFGSPETTTGGNALKFYSSVRLDTRRIGTLKDNGRPYGNRTRIKVVKNKVSAPFQQVELDLIWGRGFQLEPQLVDIGLELELLSKRGSWFWLADERLANGRAAMLELLEEDAELRETLADMIREELEDM